LDDLFFFNSVQLSDNGVNSTRNGAQQAFVFGVAEGQVGNSHTRILAQTDTIEVFAVFIHLVIDLDEFRDSLKSTKFTNGRAMIFFKRQLHKRGNSRARPIIHQRWIPTLRAGVHGETFKLHNVTMRTRNFQQPQNSYLPSTTPIFHVRVNDVV